MKRPTSILLSLLFSICIAQANTRIVENPSYEVKKTGIYHVSKIVLTDSSTRLYFLNTFIPHWWVQYNVSDYITDSKTGKTYNPIGIEGAQFGEKLWMPASGDSTIVVIYPKLDESVEKIDIGKLIFGVSLTKGSSKKESPGIPNEVTKWIDSRIAKVKAKTPVDFNSPQFFTTDTGLLIGYIKGYDTRLGFTTGIIYSNNPVTRADYPTVIQIYPDGRFEAKIPLYFPVYSYAVINDQIFNFYLEPKQTLAMILDWEEFLVADRSRNIRYQFKDITYKGPLAKMNHELMGFSPEQFNYQTFQEKVKAYSPSDFKKERQEALRDNLNKAGVYIAKSKLSKQASQLIKTDLYLQYATLLFDFVDQRRYMAQEDTLNKIMRMPETSDYYDFLKEISLNNNSLLVSNQFSVFINRFEYCTPLTVYSQRRNYSVKPEKDFITYLKEEKSDIPKADMDLLELNYKPIRTEDENALLISKKDTLNAIYKGEKLNKIYKVYSDKYIKPLIATSQTDRNLDAWKLKDSILVNVMGLQPSFVYDIAKIRSLKFALKDVSRQSANLYWDSLKVTIQHPYAIKIGEQVLRETFPDTEVTSYALKPGKATDVFRHITDPFKGKILFVDFWATSCGPCISSIKKMKAMREKYKDNPDFDFIFITDQRSSPEETYNKFVSEQDLKNTFRISEGDFYYLRQLFRFNGIPRYAVIDKDGKVISEDFEMYNFESELSKILAKK